MTVESELASLSVPLQFLAFSDAYLDSALRLCTVLSRSLRKSNYARGSVVLYLTFHAIELFLKGAILERKPNEQLRHHAIQGLSKRYRNLYPARKFAIDAPFINRDEAAITEIFAPEHLIHIRKLDRENPWDQRHRYPKNRDMQSWAGSVGFEPVSFLITIKKLKSDMARIKKLAFSIPSRP